MWDFTEDLSKDEKTSLGSRGEFNSPPRFKSRSRRHNDNPWVSFGNSKLSLLDAKQGYRQSTIRSCVGTLKSVAKKADLLNQESVKTYLVSSKVSVGRKDLSRLRFYKFKHTVWDAKILQNWQHTLCTSRSWTYLRLNLSQVAARKLLLSYSF